MAEVEEKEINLDAQILSLEKKELVEFALSLKVETSLIEGKSKVKIIKAIRNQLEVDLDSLPDNDDKIIYLDRLILSLKTASERVDERAKSVEQAEIEINLRMN